MSLSNDDTSKIWMSDEVQNKERRTKYDLQVQVYFGIRIKQMHNGRSEHRI